MDPITSFMQRRRGLDSTVSYNRDQATAFRRSGRIGGIRNTSTDAMGRRVAMPTSAQISGGTAPASFYRSQAPTRADNVRASMLDGTFGAKRAAFNAGSKGSQMDAYGNIIPAASSPPPAPAAPAAPAAPPPAAVPSTSKTSQAPAYKPPQLPAGPLSPTGRIKDESGDITGKIMGSMVDRAKASKAPLASAATNPAPVSAGSANPDPLIKQAQAYSDATKTIRSGEKIIAETQSAKDKANRAPIALQEQRKAMPDNSGIANSIRQGSRAFAAVRPVDPALIEKRGFNRSMAR